MKRTLVRAMRRLKKDLGKNRKKRGRKKDDRKLRPTAEVGLAWEYTEEQSLDDLRAKAEL